MSLLFMKSFGHFIVIRLTAGLRIYHNLSTNLHIYRKASFNYGTETETIQQATFKHTFSAYSLMRMTYNNDIVKWWRPDCWHPYYWSVFWIFTQNWCLSGIYITLVLLQGNDGTRSGKWHLPLCWETKLMLMIGWSDCRLVQCTHSALPTGMPLMCTCDIS